ncbi:MAG: helix-turn-helix transcriptional regulator, partial [Blautia sp.]|nr:helix-turn-helix transcriptional regulator [Blautia sp.]
MEQIRLAENLSRIRREQGITQEQLAEKCKVSRQAVAKWESGAALPDIYKLVELSEHLDVTTDELLFEAPKRKDMLTLQAKLADVMAKMAERHGQLFETVVEAEQRMIDEVASLKQDLDAREQEKVEGLGLLPNLTYDQDPNFRNCESLANWAKEVEPQNDILAFFIYEQAVVRGHIWSGFDALRIGREILEERVYCQDGEAVVEAMENLCQCAYTLAQNLRELLTEAEEKGPNRIHWHYKLIGE